MIKEFLIGRRPSHFQVNPIVKAFIISETFIWSCWSAIISIFPIFVANEITGGSTEIAAFSFSSYLAVRVVFELISGKYLIRSSDFKKFIVSIVGIVFVSIGYLGFVFTYNIFQIFLFYIFIGIGLGISTPAKNSLFSCHLDKNKESTEWSIYDAIALFAMAVSAIIGGFIATKYGFRFLFLMISIINAFGIIPYILFIRKKKSFFSSLLPG